MSEKETLAAQTAAIEYWQAKWERADAMLNSASVPPKS